jgi:hypothetical protein
MSAAMPGVILRTQFAMQNGILVLTLPADLAFLNGEYLMGRMQQLGSVAGVRDVAIISAE